MATTFYLDTHKRERSLASLICRKIPASMLVLVEMTEFVAFSRVRTTAFASSSHAAIFIFTVRRVSPGSHFFFPFSECFFYYYNSSPPRLERHEMKLQNRFAAEPLSYPFSSHKSHPWFVSPSFFVVHVRPHPHPTPSARASLSFPVRIIQQCLRQAFRFPLTHCEGCRGNVLLALSPFAGARQTTPPYPPPPHFPRTTHA